jgi:hypothetical protein
VFTTPVVYLAFDRLGRRRTADTAGPAGAGSPP